jgi:hypothetical protein
MDTFQSQLTADCDQIGQAALLNSGVSSRIAKDTYKRPSDIVLRGPDIEGVSVARYQVGSNYYHGDELLDLPKTRLC